MSNKKVGVWQSSKTYTHACGFSSCFRNWKADSHCSRLHGYAFEITFVFEATELDKANFVVDFGGLKNLKGELEDAFDHKTLIAADDPHIDKFEELHNLDIISLVKLPEISCERLAEFVYEHTEQWLKDAGFSPRCELVSVTFKEHDGNSATFFKCDA